MLEWTGERFLPWLKDPTLAYEHIHRYTYAANLAKNKCVLDLASGEGYGSNILAQYASSVIGVDIDQAAVEHARTKYGKRGRNVEFITGSITNVPIPDNHSFDIVVCFEAIEHIQDHDRLLFEVKRLLRPDGILVISTPNKLVYQEHSQEQNPYHIKELLFDEFKELLGKYFKHATFLGQRIYTQSSIWPLDDHNLSPIQETLIERSGDEFEFTSRNKRAPLYFIAVASDTEPGFAQPASILVDESNELLRENEHTIRELIEGKEVLAKGQEWLGKRSAEDRLRIKSLEEAVSWKDSQVADLMSAIDWMKEQTAEGEKILAARDEAIKWCQETIAVQEQTMASYQRIIASHNEALEWRASQVAELEAKLRHGERQLEEKIHQLHEKIHQLHAIESSRGWAFVLKIRKLREKFRLKTLRAPRY